jgi:hypothetical protein
MSPVDGVRMRFDHVSIAVDIGTLVQVWDALGGPAAGSE